MVKRRIISAMLKDSTVDARSGHALEEDAISSEMAQEELRRIVSSRHFRTSRRCREFLEYVVNQKISGKGDLLKERLIGVHLFGRKPDYATGEDPVVRVQAGDVRRRLESYNSDPDNESELLIEVPVGSYLPVFLLKSSLHAAIIPPETPSRPAFIAPEASETSFVQQQEPGSVTPSTSPFTSNPTPTLPLPEVNAQNPETPDTVSSRRQVGGRRQFWSLGLAALVLLVLSASLALFFLRRSPAETSKAFWLPASTSPKPVLICLPRAVVYRPSEKLFDQYAATHPDSFTTREERRDQVLPLPPTTPLRWSDMTQDRSAGTSVGAVVAAVNIGRLLAEQGIRFELRFGEEATYADMRDSPVVLVGAINTEWSTQLTSESHFVFDETRSSPNIHETTAAKRAWKMEGSNGTVTKDYGLITRQVSGKAGQFLVQVAGISHFGTEAASEFLANEQGLADALRSPSVNLRNKNVQIIVSTEVTAGRAGPPHVVAVNSW